MSFPLKKWSILLVLVGLCVLSAATDARAQFAVRIQSGAINVTILDGGAGDTNPAPNAITVVSGVGGVPVIPGLQTHVSTAITNSPGGAEALLDLSYTVSALGAAGGSVQISTSATGFTSPGPALNPLSLTSELGGTISGGTISAQQFVGLTNGQFELGPTPGLQGPFTDATSPYASERSLTFSATGQYSLTDRVNITLGAGGITTGNIASSVRGVPAPGGLALALCGLPLVGGYLLRRRQKQA